jgi:ubiquinone/menaquinone biosynthesis C-methylase UbiE
MIPAAALSEHEAAVAFDRVADTYDATFTKSSIGRAQRDVVWKAMQKAFRPGDRVLELNCGTGEDAVFLARHGVSVLGCDASSRMVEVAEHRKSREALGATVLFRVLRNENIDSLAAVPHFDGALSNFSGLNCVADTSEVARKLAVLMKPGATALICVSTRVCLWEITWYIAHGNFQKAFRRLRGRTIARLGEIFIPVWYPTIRELRRSFAPWFRLRSVRAVGLFVPPSYVESSISSRESVLRWLESMDRMLAAMPVLRGVGDHVLLEFEKT